MIVMISHPLPESASRAFVLTHQSAWPAHRTAVSTSRSPGLPRGTNPRTLVAAIELGHAVSIVCGSAYVKTPTASPPPLDFVARWFRYLAQQRADFLKPLMNICRC
jgi:hypothetical protein